MNPTRRDFLRSAAVGLGLSALGGLDFGGRLFADDATDWGAAAGALPGLPHFKPKAKRVIVLWQGGGASHVDLFDHKPDLEKMRLKELPDSVRAGARLSTMTASQK